VRELVFPFAIALCVPEGPAGPAQSAPEGVTG
jgi:hypothetical protein